MFQTADCTSPSAPVAEDMSTPGLSISDFMNMDDPPPLYGSEAETLPLEDLPAQNSEEMEIPNIQHSNGNSPCLEENAEATPMAVVSPLPNVSGPAVSVIPNSPNLSSYLVPPLIRRNRN